MSFSGQSKAVALPVEEKKELRRSKESRCIAREEEKLASKVKGEPLHCPWKRKSSFEGQRRVVALPVEEKKELRRSKQSRCNAREEEEEA